MDITSEQIAARAYERFLERGGAHGHDVEDWNAAREELQRAHQRFDVKLVDPGVRLIEVVKTIRELTGMSLREAHAVVDAPPGTLARAASADEADALTKRLDALGARVVMRATDG